MGRTLYVGNLSFSATDQVLVDTFSKCGSVQCAKIVVDENSGRSQGFGFVEMSNDAEAFAAIGTLNGFEYDGRPMIINQTKTRALRRGQPRQWFQ